MRSSSRAPAPPCRRNDAHHTRAGCPPRATPARPTALRRRAQGGQPAPLEPTSTSSRLQLAEAVGADELATLLQRELVCYADYSPGSVLKTCERTRSGGGWSKERMCLGAAADRDKEGAADRMAAALHDGWVR